MGGGRWALRWETSLPVEVIENSLVGHKKTQCWVGRGGVIIFFFYTPAK